MLLAGVGHPVGVCTCSTRLLLALVPLLLLLWRVLCVRDGVAKPKEVPQELQLARHQYLLFDLRAVDFTFVLRPVVEKDRLL